MKAKITGTTMPVLEIGLEGSFEVLVVGTAAKP